VSLAVVYAMQEEKNTFEHNLASLVHLFGYPPSNANSTGQFMPWWTQNEWLLLPADVTASGFYITNAYNSFYGNTATGGWAAYIFPNMDNPIGLSRYVRMSPKSRPTLRFEGNSARSTAYFWGQAGAIYVGGNLSYVNTTSPLLMYNPGR